MSGFLAKCILLAARLLVSTVTPRLDAIEHYLRSLDHNLQSLEQKLTSIEISVESSLEHRLATADRTKEELTMTVQTTDDNEVRIKPKAKDRDGALTALTGLTATVDQPAKASVQPDPADPSVFVVTRLPVADGDPAVLTVSVTLTDPATGLTATQAVEFDPGKAAALTLETELAPLPADKAAPPTAAPTAAPVTVPSLPAVGDRISVAATAGGPTTDHTVTAVAPDGGSVTTQPDAGGPAVTVPVTVTPAS